MNYEFMDRAFVRIPLQPVQYYNTFFSGNTREQLVKVLQDDLFMHAIYLASPQLHQTLLHTDAAFLLEDSRKARKLRATLIKYIIRMSSRCTPFGYFAGCAVAQIADQHNMVAGDPQQASVHSRLDIHYLFYLVKKIEQYEYIKPYLAYAVNTSLYQQGNNYRYIECRYQFKKRNFELTSVTVNSYIERVIRFVNAHPYASLDTIAGSLVDDEITLSDARQFVEELFNIQILVSNLELGTTGDEMLNQLIHTLEGLQQKAAQEPTHEMQLQSLLAQLYDIRHSFEAIGHAPIGEQIQGYQRLKEKVAALDDSFEEQFFVQTDMVTPYTHATINKSIYDDLQKGLDILQRLTIIRKNNTFGKFKTAFESRYESRPVPLVEALDIESGIGYGKFTDEGQGDVSPLISDLHTSRASGGAEEMTLNKKHATFWIKKINEAINAGRKTIELSEEDIASFPARPERLTGTYSLLTTLLQDASGQPVIHFKGASGPTSAMWLGRFASIDPAINALVHDVAKKEEAVHAGKIVAEITHLPDARIGNVVQRPAIRQYEIPYLSKSAVAPEQQLSINDLMLVMRSGRLVLYSKQHQQEVIPYISNAHFYGNGQNLPIYHFLGDMQEMHGRDTSRIDFADIQPFFTFIPRIQYRNIIFRRACWKFGTADLQPLFAAEEFDLTGAFAQFARLHQLPRYFSYAVSDNELVIDSQNPEMLTCLINEIRDVKEISFMEVLFQEYTPFIANAAGQHFNNETLFFVSRTMPAKPLVKLPAAPAVTGDAVTAGSVTAGSVQREFLPGSPWVYFNLYTGFKQADEILLLLQPYIRKCTHEGLLDKWFFIRYHDPKFHLRIRFHLCAPEQREAFLQHILPVLHDFRHSGLIWKMTQETYIRELERYGHHTMEVLESLFHRDSDLSADLLHYFRYKGEERDKWMAALVAMDATLNLLGYSLPEKREFTAMMAGYFDREFNGHKTLNASLDRKFRHYSKTLYDLLNGKGDTALAQDMLPIVRAWQAHAMPLVEVLKEKDVEYRKRYTDSLIHMSVNRLFRSRQRVYEYVLYDLLTRTYASMIARAKVSRVAM